MLLIGITVPGSFSSLHMVNFKFLCQPERKKTPNTSCPIKCVKHFNCTNCGVRYIFRKLSQENDRRLCIYFLLPGLKVIILN